MNNPHISQIARGFRILSLGTALATLPVPAFTPDAEAVLEVLRRRMAAGLAGQESYDAFLGLLADGEGAEGCASWAPGADGTEVLERVPELRVAIAEACPGSIPVLDVPKRGRVSNGSSRVRISHAAKPAGNSAAPPSMTGEGSAEHVRWRLSLLGTELHARSLEIRAGGFSAHAGHVHAGLSRTRLDFVAGSRFYADWTGASGARGPLFSPDAALDGLGASRRAGAWTLDAAGTWNRLSPGGIRPHAPRRDAALYLAGLARDVAPGGGGGKGSRSGNPIRFRGQIAHQRFESAAGPPLSLTVAGAAIANRDGTLRLGLAGSLLGAGAGKPGGYAEVSAASGSTAAGRFRLEARQASAHWANPLQSPRGYLRDTLAGQWVLPGRGEGGLAVHGILPVADMGGYRASLHSGGSAAWVLGEAEILAGQGRVAWVQEFGPWAHEIGTDLRHRRSDLPSLGEGSGLGQDLTWRGQAWTAKASFLLRRNGYRGSRPAPLVLSCGHKARRASGAGGDSWSIEGMTGDARRPMDYSRLALRQGWELGRGFKADQALRLPWSRGRLSGEMGYQLRLEALF